MTDSEDTRRPNVVWILLDASRASHFSAYGYERQTSPTIDSLAHSGVVFENAFAQSFATRDSVPSYMTGRYMAVPCMSVSRWQTMFLEPPPFEQLFPVIARDNGYRTVMVSAHPFITPETRLSKSFDDVVHLRGHPYSGVFDVVSQADLALDRLDERPFFLYVHLLDTHFPHRLEPPYDQWLDRRARSPQMLLDQPRFYENADFTQGDKEYLRGLHDGSILQSDAGIARLIAALKARRLFENTVFIIGGDHGEVLGEDGATVGHGSNSFDEVMRVPLIVSGPGVPVGERYSPSVANLDIVPTLVGLLGFETSAEFHGRSLLPYVTGVNQGVPHEFIGAVNYGDRWVVRSESFTLHRRWDGVEEFWQTPYSILGQTPAVGVAEVEQTRMRTFLTDTLLALDAARRSLPLRPPDMPFYEKMTEENIVDRGFLIGIDGEITREGPPAAARWIVHSDGVTNNGWSSDAPPLHLKVRVPNAEYVVQIELFTTRFNDRSGSALSVRAQNDREFKEVRDESNTGFRFVELGRYSVTDGYFVLDVLPAEDGVWAAFRRLRFVPAELASDSPEDALDEVKQREEAIRALGYAE